MKTIFGNELAKSIREISDKTENRLWIAVPYIGNQTSIRRILGKKWYENPKISVKLLTDISDLTCIDTETCKIFHGRGEMKSIKGLHAKIYIFDNICLITSANLTNTAFSKRHEIGVILDETESESTINIFKEWWLKSESVKMEEINKIYTIKKSSNEETQTTLDTIWDLPNDPGGFIKSFNKNFLGYKRLLTDYNDFCDKYISIQRIWPNEPIYFEIDGLLNYLYHYAPTKPSKPYSNGNSRELTENQQLLEIKKWAKEYKKWNNNQINEDIEFRKKNSKTLRKLLSIKNVLTLDVEGVKSVCKCLNTYTSRPINRTKLINNNRIEDIIDGLNELVNGKGELAARMNYCNNIKYMGSSSMNEIIAYTNPDKYPIINENTNSGMRFFGYKIKSL